MDFVRIGLVDYEVISDTSDFVPNQEVSIQQCVDNGVVPPEVTNLEYDSDENGENVSFDDAHPIIPDKIAALERLNDLERQYQQAKSESEAAAAADAAQKMASASATIAGAQVNGTQPSEAQA